VLSGESSKGNRRATHDSSILSKDVPVAATNASIKDSVADSSSIRSSTRAVSSESLNIRSMSAIARKLELDLPCNQRFESRNLGAFKHQSSSSSSNDSQLTRQYESMSRSRYTVSRSEFERLLERSILIRDSRCTPSIFHSCRLALFPALAISHKSGRANSFNGELILITCCRRGSRPF
jgi:hypothetical protein